MKCHAVILSLASAAAAVLLPSQDPFYTQPANIDNYKPGAVINSRKVPTNLNNILDSSTTSEKVKAAYQYLYRTTDSLGNAVAAVTTMLVPFNADSSKLLAYQQAYDSSNNNCSPSYALQSGANTTASADIIMIIAALDKGWYVITPDFEGLQAEFTAGVQSGYATLDSVRAAFHKAKSSGLSPSAKYAMWGYSGGALASEWAAELQPKYASELNFQGIALGGLTPNVTSVLHTINQGPFAGLAFSGTYGLSKAYPSASAMIENQLIPSKKAQFYSIANGCLSQATESGAFKNIYSYFVNGEATFNEPAVRKIQEEGGQMGTHGVPASPLFVYKAIGDEISPVADTDELVSKLCSEGVSIQYQKNLVGEHASEAITGAGAALSWVQDRLNGVPTAKGCSTQYVTVSSVNAGVFGADAVLAEAALQNILGGDAGSGLDISG